MDERQSGVNDRWPHRFIYKSARQAFQGALPRGINTRYSLLSDRLPLGEGDGNNLLGSASASTSATMCANVLTLP